MKLGLPEKEYPICETSIFGLNKTHIKRDTFLEILRGALTKFSEKIPLVNAGQ